MSFEIVDIEPGDNFQDLKIPGRFKIDDDKVYIKKAGNVIYLIPFHHAWDSLKDAANNFSDDYMEKRDQPWIEDRETF
jgi:antitoxin VapB